MYARIDENGCLRLHDKRYIVIGKAVTSNPSEKLLRRAGYKPLVTPPEPTLKAGQTLGISYEDKGDRIECVYEVMDGLKR